jgi:hypothetical protein
MSLSQQEQELVISKCADEKQWCCTSSDPMYTRRLRKLAAALNIPVKELNEHTIRVYLPVKCLTLRTPLVLSDEQRALRADALRKRLHGVG